MDVINYVEDGSIWFWECKKCPKRIHIRMPHSAERLEFFDQVNNNGWQDGICPSCQNGHAIELVWRYKKPVHIATHKGIIFKIRKAKEGRVLEIHKDGKVQEITCKNIPEGKQLAVKNI